MEYVCCICGGWFEGWGNNPWPIVNNDDAICCDKCNAEKVIPERINLMMGHRNGTEQS